ncbi:MAG: GNAT family N-acetyltransferase [Thermoleophilia bacterium]|nr:GNAT family N-acetyltransferase [Thermoleophilia bacterium]
MLDSVVMGEHTRDGRAEGRAGDPGTGLPRPPESGSSPPANDAAPLPGGYRVRRPERDDFDDVVALLVAADLALVGDTDWSPMELGYHWRRPRFSLERDAWVVEAEGGGIVAYAWSYNDEPEGQPTGYFGLHPEHRDPALARHLLALIERRAGEQLASRAWGEPAVGAWFLEEDGLKRALYESAGYAQVRVFERMVVAAADVQELDETPAGIELRPMRRPDDERAVHDCVEEAFVDHFRYAPLPFDEFWAPFDDTPAEDQVWLVACDGPEIVGVALGLSLERYGYVDLLAVRRPWRGRHIGLALLVATLVRLRDLGHERLTLGVDATNPTGAAHLYRRAGMSVRQRVLYFEKPMP